MFEIPKKDKQQRINRQSLKMFVELVEASEGNTKFWDKILKKKQPKITDLNLLQATTCLQVNYLMQTMIQLCKRKQKAFQQQKYEANQNVKEMQKNINQMEIGIIGAGVIGRLILNSLLVFTKEGVDPKRISVSTRQYEDLKTYNTNFGVQLLYDNQLLAQKSDILFICTPSTLDNWIICDLKEILQNRVNQLDKMNPLVFVTTSNMSQQKLKKIFDIPIMCPSIRGDNQEQIKELSKAKSCQDIQKVSSNFIFSQQKIQQIKEVYQFMYYKLFTPSKTNSYASSSYQYETSRSISAKRTPIVKSVDSSLRQSKNKQNSIDDEKEGIILLKELIEQVLYAQNNSISETYLKRARQWRMAYHNFIV